jgi:hypothetical protein
MRLTGNVAGMGDVGNAYYIFLGKPEGKRPLERTRRRGKDDIKMCLTEGVYWIYLAQNRHQWWALVNTVMNMRVP